MAISGHLLLCAPKDFMSPDDLICRMTHILLTKDLLVYKPVIQLPLVMFQMFSCHGDTMCHLSRHRTLPLTFRLLWLSRGFFFSRLLKSDSTVISHIICQNVKSLRLTLLQDHRNKSITVVHCTRMQLNAVAILEMFAPCKQC